MLLVFARLAHKIGEFIQNVRDMKNIEHILHEFLLMLITLSKII
jgi:hypothetical protein